jgi:hypothetical protein
LHTNISISCTLCIIPYNNDWYGTPFTFRSVIVEHVARSDQTDERVLEIRSEQQQEINIRLTTIRHDMFDLSDQDSAILPTTVLVVGVNAHSVSLTQKPRYLFSSSRLFSGTPYVL